MSRLSWIIGGLALVIIVVVVLGVTRILMPGAWSTPSRAPGYQGLVAAEKLLRVPVTGIYPGGTSAGLQTNLENPLKNDPDAVVRGQKDFATFNCIGCHMPHAGGGMGPALSNHVWIYRDSAANIYLDIAQGRSAGMPAFGAMLPDRTIWELVAYVQSLSASPDHAFGITTSTAPDPSAMEQVPAGQADSPAPWKNTETMPPHGEKNGAGDQPPDAPLPPNAEQAPLPRQPVPQ